MVRLSIITINYNNREGLARTIASVKAQNFSDYEWLVIDGGSTDGSRELIEANKALFAYWCSEPDKGIYDAINKGTRHASGQYVSCMNSGDTYFSDDTLSRVFASPLTADVIYGDWYKVYPERRVLCSMPCPLDLSSMKASMFRSMCRLCTMDGNAVCRGNVPACRYNHLQL